MDMAFGTLVITIIAFVISLFVWAIVDAIFAETFSLRKDSWGCSAQRLETSFTTITDADGRMQTVPTVHQVCVQWTRTH